VAGISCSWGVGLDGGANSLLEQRLIRLPAHPRTEAVDENLGDGGAAGHDPCIDTQRPPLYGAGVRSSQERAVSKRSFSTFAGTRVG
jgi:hypothetical protein